MTTATTETYLPPGVLARVVASSDDRETWLAGRATGVTATEIAKLAKSATARRTLLASKLAGGQERNLERVRAIRHGRLREPVLAAWVQQRFGIAPNSRLLAAVGNPRHLATPDGMSVNFDEELRVSELKTSNDDLDPAKKRSAFVSKGYRDQVQWQLYVTGAERLLFAWEQHDGDWSEWPDRSPAPLHAEPRFVWIERDEERIAHLITVADEFLAELDAAIKAGGAVAAAAIDDDLDTSAVNYLRFLDEEKRATVAKKESWSAMQQMLADHEAFSQESGLARVTWSPPSVSLVDVPDVEAAKAADPALFAEVQALSKRWNEHQAKFVRQEEKTSGGNLRVTAAKETKR